MAGGSRFVWIPLLLSCVFHASDHRHVHQAVTCGHKVDSALSNIPTTVPEGLDPSSTDQTSAVQTCSGMEKQLTELKRQLRQTTLLNGQHNEAFGLRRKSRELQPQIAACSSTASAYQTQLHFKLKSYLDALQSDTFLPLKILALTQEVNILQRRVQLATNSTETTADIQGLQRELEAKTNELKNKTQQSKRSNTNSLILQIVSLQSQIWDLEQAQKGGSSFQNKRRIQALQNQLDSKIRELQAAGHPFSATLELINLQGRITLTKRLLSDRIEESRSNTADYQRQLRQKAELLTRKINQLNQDEHNSELTKEILILQGEVDHLRRLMLDGKRAIETQISELRAQLVEERKRLEVLQKQLEEADYIQTELIMKIIQTLKELRELQYDEQNQTTAPTNQITTLQSLLQVKEAEYTKAQAEIRELQRKLQKKRKECSGFEERYDEVKTELQLKIGELNRTEEQAALILTVLNLHNELQNLRDLISTTDDADRRSELQSQLKRAQEELNSKTADIERGTGNPEIILTVIELQNQIWDDQRKAPNGTNADNIKVSQNRVDSLINGIDDKDNGNTKLMLRIMTLQSQVDLLKRQLANMQVLDSPQVTQLRNELQAKTNELQRYVNQLNTDSNSRLILRAIELQNQLRNLEAEQRTLNNTSTATIPQLQEQLRAKMEEHSRDQAEIKALQTQLQAKEREEAAAQAQITQLQEKLKSKGEECSAVEDRLQKVKAEYELKISELSRTGDPRAALILNVVNLQRELNALKSLNTTEHPDRIPELQRQLREKQEELNSKTAEMQRLFGNPNLILNIIEMQNQLWDYQRKPVNETTSKLIQALLNDLDGLLGELGDDDPTKLIIKVLKLQSEVDLLQTQLSNPTLNSPQGTQLRNALAAKKRELEENVNKLNEKHPTNAGLIITVTNLQNQLRNLEKEKNNVDRTTSAAITKLREQLKAEEEEHARDRAELNALQKKLNQTEEQCFDHEQNVKNLQNDLDAKMKELQSKSDSITSLVLQVSTLTLQVEELKKQQQHTDYNAKIAELQKTIDQKTAELNQKKEELKQRSTQPLRFLQIIAIQTEIERLTVTAVNESDYDKIQALQDHLDNLISGIRDENDENSKLLLQVLSQQEELARLRKQMESQLKAQQQKIQDLEEELQDARNQIKEKTALLSSSDIRVANLSAQIMELHKKLKPLESEISNLKETHAETLQELQNKLIRTKKQLEDSERLFKEADSKNFESFMEIADLRSQLKKAEKQAAKAAKKNIEEVEQQLQTLQKTNKKLEKLNKDLTREIQELKTCCTDESNQCDDLQKQLQQSQEDADRLRQQLREKDAAIKTLEKEVDDLTKANNQLQHEYSNLEGQHQNTQASFENLQQQLDEKDTRIKQLEQDLEDQTNENGKLMDDYNDLQNEKNKLEDYVQDLQNKLSDVEDKTIYARKMTFDPDTANPRIALSARNTEMSISEHNQNIPDSPARFDVALAVLGQPGFSAGRNYWEVSVAGKRCYHIGMASESAPRKGSIGFNPTNGYWTIVLNKQGQYRAVDRRPVVIPLQTQPLILGILLDYKKGQISFYDAAARSHIYSFVGQSFTGKIHPFVNFCIDDVENRTPIALQPPGSVDWIN